MDKSYDPTSELKAIKALYEDAVKRNSDLIKTLHIMGEMHARSIADAKAETSRVIEQCARIAEEGCLVPPDGGSPSDEEVELCQYIAFLIRRLQGHEPKSGDHNPS